MGGKSKEESATNNSNHNTPSYNFNLDTNESIIKQSKFVHINIKILIILLTFIICVLLFNTILFTYQYYHCKSSNTHNVSDEIIENLLNNEKIKSKRHFNGRLPTSIKPVAYRIKIVPYLNNFTFSGEVYITMSVLSKTDNITIHMNDLIIIDFSLKRLNKIHSDGFSSGEKFISISEIRNDSYNQFMILDLGDSVLEPQYQYELYVKYVGYLNQFMHGLYRSRYQVNNVTRWIVATQFEPTDARRAFPCFDEPGFKATFEISIGRLRNMSSISNMPRIISEEEDTTSLGPGYVWDHFESSVNMSTYLVAMAVTDFGYRQNVTSRFTVWTRPGALDQAEYSLLKAPKILETFTHYFNYRYPLEKTDMIALPDFSAGAMENFGLLTFRENAMLYDPNMSPNFQKERVATILSHELAHQWFGNMVTLLWWNDLWLNEGLASYLQYLGVDAVEPSWRIYELFVVEELQNVFSLDALKSSHPVQQEVSRPEEITEIFDKISYSKGASLVRMADHFLTKEVLRSGLEAYIGKRVYKSATQSELWEELTTVAHQMQALPKNFDMATIMNTWTLETGFPVITVLRNYESGSATISQDRFLLEPTNEDLSKRPLWWVPLTFTTESRHNFETTKPSHWLEKRRSMVIKTDALNAKPDEWVIFNLQETGFYRVQYDLRNWNLIIDTLKDPTRFQDIHLLNRAQLIDDSMTLARAGQLDYHIALNVTSYLRHERELVPWRSAIKALGYIESQLCRKPAFEKYKTYVLFIMKNLYDEVGFDQDPTDDQLTIYKRIDILNSLCSLGHTRCVSSALNKYQNWVVSNSTSILPPNLKAIITCTQIRFGSSADWDFMWEKYKTSQSPSEKDTFLSSLACSSEYWVLTRYLDYAITPDSPIRKQDASRVFAAVAQSAIGHTVAFNFLLENFQKIHQYFGDLHFHVASIFKYCTGKISTQSELEQLKSFIRQNIKDLSCFGRSILQVRENAQTNVNWIKRNYEPIVSWLSNKKNFMDDIS